MSASAIDNSPSWSLTEFNFNPSGARARGFGGAFVGVADDATAATNNPAGLAQLPKTQIAVEGSYIDSGSETLSWPSDNNENGSVKKESTTDISFLAVSLPITDSFYGAFFYNRLANQQASMFLPEGPAEIGGAQAPFYNAKNDLRLDEYGVSGALSLADGQFRLGLGISMVHMDLDAQSKSDTLGASSAIADSRAELFRSTSGGSGIAYRLGGLWAPNERLRVGASANIYPSIDYQTTISARILSTTDLTGRLTYAINTGQLPDFRDTLTFNDELDIPDVYAAGFAYLFGDNLTLSFEARYTKYSQMEIQGIPVSPYRSGEAFDATFWNPGSMAPWGQNYVESTPGEYSIDDAWSWHLGIEYLAELGGTPLALRLGGYYEQAHGLKYSGTEAAYNNDGSDINRPFAFSGYPTAFADVLDGGEDVWHFTPGMGAVFGNHWQLDIAADISKKQNEYLASLVYQF